MKLETKLNLNDEVHFISDAKKACQSVVRGMKIEINQKGLMTVVYLCNRAEGESIAVKVDEPDAYKSKEELLKSL